VYSVAYRLAFRTTAARAAALSNVISTAAAGHFVFASKVLFHYSIHWLLLLLVIACAALLLYSFAASAAGTCRACIAVAITMQQSCRTDIAVVFYYLHSCHCVQCKNLLAE
jgi:hypothetical protein